MATSVEISKTAKSEFNEAFDWYAKRSLGAAIGFASEIDAAIEKIGADPVSKNLRRLSTLYT